MNLSIGKILTRKVISILKRWIYTSSQIAAPRKRKRTTACDSQVQSEVWIPDFTVNCASKPSVRKIVVKFSRGK